MEVSILGLGTVKLGRNQGVRYPQDFELPDDTQASKLIALARDQGINLIDTAPAYGTSEERLGQLLRGQRDRWLICSKVGEEFANGQSSFNFTTEYAQFSIERSLQRLKTDVLDIVLIHSDGNDLEIINGIGTLDALADLKRQGKLRAFGMSTKTVAGGLLAAQKSDIVMVTWNLEFQEDIPIIDYCQQHGKGVLIKKAFASGHLTQAGQAIKNKGLLIDQSLAMIFSHPGVSSAIIGTINPDHLQANIDRVNKSENR
ncbi:MAG: aldo/keto reductase [Gammaproteobacteria bacterium]|nr:MAG: aldo/keto reductase [Gammaproteobacteria bacterium]